jgi:hypothetical protein
MFMLQQSDKRSHNLEAVVSTVKLSVVVKRGTYTAICNNYIIIENYLQSGPNTDMRCIMFQRCIHTFIHINVCIIKIWLNNIK